MGSFTLNFNLVRSPLRNVSLDTFFVESLPLNLPSQNA